MHNLATTLKLRIDIDRIDSNSNFAGLKIEYFSKKYTGIETSKLLLTFKSC